MVPAHTPMRTAVFMRGVGLCIVSITSFPLGALASQAPATVPAAASPVPTAGSPTAEQRRRGAELIARAVDAFGGAAAVDAVKALEVKSKGTRRIQGGDLDVTTVTRYFPPDHYYQELVLPMGTMKTVVSPTGAFIVAGEGSLPLPEGERQALLKLMQRSLVALLKARREPGFSAVAAGSTTVNGRAAELVRVASGGETVTLAIDPSTGQVLQSVYDSPPGGAAPAGQLVITYSDYRAAGPGSIAYPFTAVGTMAGEPAFQQKVESVVVNPTLDEALFKAPAGHAMFPGVEDLPLPSPPPLLIPIPSPKPSPSPTHPPQE